MARFVEPKVFYLGATCINWQGLKEYLEYTGNQDFMASANDAREQGISEGEILCSMFAKLCYKALSLGKNKNVSRIRDIEGNLKGCLAQAHGSIWEHCQLNFIATDVSRIQTHEQVRHRIGSSYSQTSGRYVRGDSLDVVFDPILDKIKLRCEGLLYYVEAWYNEMVKELCLDQMTDFDQKKKITSALRRFLPNGQANEMGFSHNLRTLRHVVQMRTSRHAEREIRVVYGQVYELVKTTHPLIFCDAKVKEVDGLKEVYGMKMNPYEAPWPEES